MKEGHELASPLFGLRLSTLSASLLIVASEGDLGSAVSMSGLIAASSGSYGEQK
jgi:hypothetical protein